MLTGLGLSCKPDPFTFWYSVWGPEMTMGGFSHVAQVIFFDGFPNGHPGKGPFDQPYFAIPCLVQFSKGPERLAFHFRGRQGQVSLITHGLPCPSNSGSDFYSETINRLGGTADY